MAKFSITAMLAPDPFNLKMGLEPVRSTELAPDNFNRVWAALISPESLLAPDRSTLNSSSEANPQTVPLDAPVSLTLVNLGRETSAS